MSEFWLNVRKKVFTAYPEVLRFLVGVFSDIIRTARSLATDVIKTILGK